MRIKPRSWFVVSLVLFAAGGWMWRYAEKVGVNQSQSASGSSSSASWSSSLLGHPGVIKVVGSNGVLGRKSYRVSNTRETAGELLRNNHAVLLRNALIDTSRPLHLEIPSQLRSQGAAGSYIVQFDRALDREFYEAVKKDGGEFVGYIPNNAGLVKANAEQARTLESDPVFQAVLPYEPYYKLDSSLLPGAVEGLPQTNLLSVTTFAGQREAALRALEDLGAKLVGEDSGPFGPTLVVSAPPESVATIAQLPLAQEVETYARRRLLNDLSRVQLGVSADTLTNTPDYLNLSGSNITVSLNDTGVDSTHPDFTGKGTAIRLKGAAGALIDDDGHGTHVGGIIIGNGSQSGKVTNQVPGSVAGADFRGKATNATLYVQNLDLIIGPFVSDNQLQINASTNLGPTNLISNNSWGYSGMSYDMHAASFDAATRDAQPMLKGEQPLLFVFASGDSGHGDDSGIDGQGGTINSPGSAKNVITVGATDAPRFLTNQVSYDGQTTNQVFLGATDNSNLVAYFSGCGNVGLGVEGITGRFKPDVVAPGTFIVSTRSHNYVDPTNETLVTDNAVTNQTVDPGKTNYYPIVYPPDGSELVIQIVTNAGSPAGYTNGFIVRAGPRNPPATIRGTNILGAHVVILTNQIVPGPIFVGVASAGSLQPVTYDLHMYVLETNNFGDYFTVLSTMNAGLAPNYRYESGTSMSAGAVSGVLALMQDFLENRLHIVPSPALLKALLINGSRSLGQEYDFDIKTLGANEQGWGMPNLANSIPTSFTNSASGRSLAFFDQSPANALATGQYQTYTVTDPGGKASNAPIRISLVWTDPPGDPAAGIALVNQLSLTVTDHTGTNIYIGNDFLGGDIFSEVNSGDAPDVVNNVQNIYIDPTFTPVIYPLTITVGGARVNVNALTTRTNIIGQDYALVISGDDPTVPLTVVSNAVLTLPPAALVTQVTNGIPLLHERVGANQPTQWNYQTGGTNGNLSQWHFFIFTNLSLYTNGPDKTTNVAFATFLPPNLSTPRNTDADLDMYVSTDPRLLQLNKLAVYNAFKSVGRGGTETFVTNSTATTWYIGIKAEDQQAADFGFYAVAQQDPFSLRNPDGSVTARGTALPVFIPDAASGAPALVFAFLVDPINPTLRLQNTVVRLGIQHGNPSDLYGTLTHNGVSTIINHNSGPPGGFTNVYDDLQEQPNGAPPDILTDGPGSLKNFVGQAGQGLWMLTEADNALGQSGEVEIFEITATPQPEGLGFTITLAPDSWYKGYVPVPNDATNLTIFTTYASQGGGPIGIFLTNFDDVNFGDYTTNQINPPGGSLTLNTNPPKPYPPLSGGNWYYGIYNYNDTTPVTLNVLIQIQESLTPDLVETFSNNTITPLLTGGHTQSQICIASGQQVVDLSVGLRINDTNLDDLSIHLTSPEGTSVLLFENRGGLAAQNLGLGTRQTSNLVYTVFTEDTNLSQTPVKFASVFATTATTVTNTTTVTNSFETSAAQTYTNGQTVEGGWVVVSNQVGVVTDPTLAHTGQNFMALTSGRIANTITTVPGGKYQMTYWARGPGIISWYPGDGTPEDIIEDIYSNGTTVNGVTYGAGEVGEAFSFAGPGVSDIQIANAPIYDVPSVTVECWFNAANSAESGFMVYKPFARVGNSYAIGLGSGNLTGNISSKNVSPKLTYAFTPVPGEWYHGAMTYNANSGVQALYLDGLEVKGTTAAAIQIAYDANPVYIGGGGFIGKADEVSIYDRALSPAELMAIYNAGSQGKYSTTSLLPNIEVTIDGFSTNTIILPNFDGEWQKYTNSFVATNTRTTIEFAGNALSALLDDIVLVKSPAAISNNVNYFLPEEPLTSFIGQNPQGCWTLDVWDTRLDSSLPKNGTLLSWDLQTTISSTNANPIVLTNGVAYTNGQVAGDSVTYFAIDVPLTANFATNILSKGSHPLNLLFDQYLLPTGGLAGDVTMISGLKAGTSGTNTLAAQGTPPPLLPGQRYFLAVQNSGPKGATFTLEVDFDSPTGGAPVTILTNQMEVATNIANAGPEYYSFTVPPDASMVTFQVLNAGSRGPAGRLSGELGLYVRAGLPLAGLENFNYESRNGVIFGSPVSAPSDQFIVVTTNSVPVPLETRSSQSAKPLSPTTWYLTVNNNLSVVGNQSYTILATFMTNGPNGTPGAMNIIPLKDNVIFGTSALPGYPTNIVYSFEVTNHPTGVQFAVTDLAGAGRLELFANNDGFPSPQRAFSESLLNSSRTNLIVIGTNSIFPSADGTWYLAVANTSGNVVPYNISATTIITNKPIISHNLSIRSDVLVPTGAFSFNWESEFGESYRIEDSTDLLNWFFVTNIVGQSNSAGYTGSIPMNAEPARFFRVTTQ